MFRKSMYYPGGLMMLHLDFSDNNIPAEKKEFLIQFALDKDWRWESATDMEIWDRKAYDYYHHFYIYTESKIMEFYNLSNDMQLKRSSQQPVSYEKALIIIAGL